MTLLATAFFNASLFSCLMPILLLIALATWYVRDAGRMPDPGKFFRKNGGDDHTDAGSGGVGNG